MRYNYEFKRKCVELYRKGLWAETPKGITTKRFKKTIREWSKIEEALGPEGLKHPKTIKQWSPEEKLELVSKVLSGCSVLSITTSVGLSNALLYKWVQNYKDMGYNGLINQKRGRRPKEKPMKKNININRPVLLNESEREELIRLRVENEYIKAENEVIKKEIALREKNQAAQLKAKKQQSLKNLEKKGTN